MAREGAKRGWQDPASERERELAEGRRLDRPVKLLALIEKLEQWTVDEAVMAAVMEAVEAGIAVDSVYEGQRVEVFNATAEEEEERPAARATASPVGVYRLGDGSVIHFGRDGLPASPPVQHFYHSELDTEHCYACELHSDRMTADVPPYFRLGDILIFSSAEHPRSGDFCFVKTRTGDEFTQVFFGHDDTVRLRPLNGKYAERTVKRAEIKEIHRLVGRYQRFASA